MNSRFHCLLVAGLTGLLGLSLLPMWLGAADTQVGLSVVDITPPVGGRTTGYAEAQPTDGVHDPLDARILFLKSDSTNVALVCWDLCVINSPWLFERVLVNDDLAVMTMPGEPFHRLQVEFRQKAGVPHAFVFGYCSNGPYDWPSYLPDIESAAFGGYGASDTTRAEVGTPERLVLRGLEQVYTLQGRLRSAPVRHTNQ